MSIATADLAQLTETVWTSFLEMEAQPCPEGMMPLGRAVTWCAQVQSGRIAALLGAGPNVSGSVAGCAEIQGAEQYAVLLICPTALARRAASRIFQRPAEEVEPEQMEDALQELTNIIAGNVKALLGEPAVLTLPRVGAGIENASRLSFCRPIAQAWFRCEEEPFLVVLMRRGD
jgi:CheY-specific phosphatase CheX